MKFSLSSSSFHYPFTKHQCIQDIFYNEQCASKISPSISFKYLKIKNHIHQVEVLLYVVCFFLIDPLLQQLLWEFDEVNTFDKLKLFLGSITGNHIPDIGCYKNDLKVIQHREKY